MSHVYNPGFAAADALVGGTAGVNIELVDANGEIVAVPIQFVKIRGKWSLIRPACNSEFFNVDGNGKIAEAT